jgi:hypothetical protein
MKIMSVVAGIAVLLSVTACTPSPVHMSSKDMKELIGQIQYAKDPRTGICFASIASMGSDGYSHLSITEVPCGKVEDFLVNK